jgi:tetratricopeptide (TPR) repeat protein
MNFQCLSLYAFSTLAFMMHQCAAHAGKVRCGESQSCVPAVSNFSPIPRIRFSPAVLKAAQKPDLGACINGTLTMDVSKTAADCEAFLKTNKGSVHDRARAMFMLGHAYTRTDRGSAGLLGGGTNKSMEVWARANELDPTYIDPLLSIGRMYEFSGQPAKALEVLAKAELASPKDWRVYTNRSAVFRQMSNAVAMLQQAEKALLLNPAEPEVHRAYAVALEHNFHDVEAAQHYLIAAETYDPKKDRSLEMMREQSAWVSLAFMYAKLQKPAMAAAAITKLIDSDTEHGPDFILFKQRSAYYEQAKIFDRAAEDIQLALERAPEHERENLIAKRAALLAMSGAKAELGTDLQRMLENGSLKSRLKVQLFLKNQGYSRVTINGRYDDATKDALEACLQDKACAPGVGRAI